MIGFPCVEVVWIDYKDLLYENTYISTYKVHTNYLEHEKDCIEDNEGHNEVLEGGGLYEAPQFVLVTVPLLVHTNKLLLYSCTRNNFGEKIQKKTFWIKMV